jgi:hypothetical protein
VNWFHHDEVEKLAKDIRKLFEHILGENMSQSVKITVQLTINPPVPPLVATPTAVTLPAETSGTAVTAVPIAVVSGGTPPYSQPVIDPTSPTPLPSGMTVAIDGAGNVTLSGTPPVETSTITDTFVLDVSDSTP